ncbi:hypothetical protein BCR34DRAFT_608119 [Clohesyomyces aquaticus]|uniref:Uncharacterized protein n=1 Tax=Clohesyomyces aquaticus TaxID=1231657 RepID=A0A1Y1YBE4_9PLEO|nr:hypothetical protein BCR34DRAFT_608119 [Clohesyomyces aquaticus]
MGRRTLHRDRFDPAVHETESNAKYAMHENWKEYHPRAMLPRRAEDNHGAHASYRARSPTRNNAPISSLDQDIASLAADRTPLRDRRESIRSSIVPVPVTAMSLNGYDDELRTKNFRFRHSDGKVNPGRYGFVRELDLGLCYTTFLTESKREYSTHCPYRHHPLTVPGIDWIESLGFRNFVDRAIQFWGSPEMAFPTFMLSAWQMKMKKELVEGKAVEGKKRRYQTQSPVLMPLLLIRHRNIIGIGPGIQELVVVQEGMPIMTANTIHPGGVAVIYTTICILMHRMSA